MDAALRSLTNFTDTDTFRFGMRTLHSQELLIGTPVGLLHIKRRGIIRSTVPEILHPIV